MIFFLNFGQFTLDIDVSTYYSGRGDMIPKWAASGPCFGLVPEVGLPQVVLFRIHQLFPHRLFAAAETKC